MQFIDLLIKQAGLDKMPTEFLGEYREKLAAEAQKRVGLAAMAELSADQIEEFNKLSVKTNNDPQAINDYLVSHIADFEVKMSEALKQFGDEVLASAKRAQ